MERFGGRFISPGIPGCISLKIRPVKCLKTSDLRAVALKSQVEAPVTVKREESGGSYLVLEMYPVLGTRVSPS